MALQILTHFGYGDDSRTEQAWEILGHVIRNDPEQLGCAVADRGCRSAGVKALGALLHRGGDRPLDRDLRTIDLLCRYLLDQSYDWEERDADWRLPRFPRYYDTDLVELAHMLAHTRHRDTPLCRGVVARMLKLQNGEGRWIKAKNTPAFPEERVMQPSRWLTFEAVHALMLIHGDPMYAS